MHFGSKTIAGHLVRGALAAAAIYLSSASFHWSIWPSVVLLPLAIFLLKGCPLCWTYGFVETVAMSVHKHYSVAEQQPKNWPHISAR